MTLDAFGPDTVFTGKVIHIDPSATTTDGIANYQIKASVEKPICEEGKECPKLVVRPGMNANITITAWDGYLDDPPDEVVLTMEDAALLRDMLSDFLADLSTNDKTQGETA